MKAKNFVYISLVFCVIYNNLCKLSNDLILKHKDVVIDSI